MNKALPYSDLVALESLMQRMLSSAQVGDWDEVSRLDNLRNGILGPERDDSSTDVVAATTTHDYQQLQEAVLILDQNILKAAVDARASLAQEGKDLRKQVSAMNSYQQANSLNSGF